MSLAEDHHLHVSGDVLGLAVVVGALAVLGYGKGYELWCCPASWAAGVGPIYGH
jgi:hypothetical protein